MQSKCTLWSLKYQCVNIFNGVSAATNYTLIPSHVFGGPGADGTSWSPLLRTGVANRTIIIKIAARFVTPCTRVAWVAGNLHALPAQQSRIPERRRQDLVMNTTSR